MNTLVDRCQNSQELRCTPAMVAGVTKRLRENEDIVALSEAQHT